MSGKLSRSADGLLHCPFCGPGNSMVDPWFDDVSKRWAIGCGRCGSSSGRSVHAEGSKEAAIKSWNTRGLTPTRDAAEGAEETIPLADHDEIGRKVLSLPWDVQSAIVTITAHCTALKDEHAAGVVSDIAGCISQHCLNLANALRAATPQPAPDAMRISDAQLSEGIKWIDWNDALNIHDEMKQLRKAVERMFCLILPTDCPPNLTEEICAIVDQCRRGHVIGAECGKAIYSAVAKYAALSAPEGDAREAAEQLDGDWLPPNPAIEAMFAATPPVRGDREAIARIIDPEAWEDTFDGWAARQHIARSKADAISVQPGAGEREFEWQDFASAPNEEIEVRGIWRTRGGGVDFTHWRPRQPPQSSREG